MASERMTVEERTRREIAAIRKCLDAFLPRPDGTAILNGPKFMRAFEELEALSNGK